MLVPTTLSLTLNTYLLPKLKTHLQNVKCEFVSCQMRKVIEVSPSAFLYEIVLHYLTANSLIGSL